MDDLIVKAAVGSIVGGAVAFIWNMFRKLFTKADVIENKVSNLEPKLDSMRERVSKLEHAEIVIARDLNNINVSLAKTDTKLDGMNHSVQNLEKTIAKLIEMGAK